MSIKRLAILIAIVVVGLIVLGRAGTVLVDWLWFSSIGYVGVFWTIITTRAVVFLVVLAVSAGAFFLSGGLALRFAGQPAVWPPPARARPFRDRARKPRSSFSVTPRRTSRGAFSSPAWPSFSAC